MTQLQAFTFFLKSMDIVMLDEVLTDDICYCGTTKEIFLEKLQDVFNWNLSLKNDILHLEWSEINSNYLHFFRWHPNDYENTFLVTTKENGRIKSFINKRPHFGFYNFAFRVYDDEEIGFVKTSEFIMLQNKCKQAIEKMTGVTYTTDLILNWVSHYETLYLEIKDEDDEPKFKNIKYVEEFFWMWDYKSFQRESILNFENAELALLEYHNLEEREWLDKYYYLYWNGGFPRDTTAEFICEREYRFSEGDKQYQSKELFCVEKFFELYCNLNRKLSGNSE